MFKVTPTSRQPRRKAWTMERLINERSISLGYSLDSSSFGAYTSALNSYLTFCDLHGLPVTPTPDTLSFYVVFLSSHIEPRSVDSYLSGICRQLEPFFPEVRQNRKTILVSRTMAGCLRRFGTPIKRKAPFSHADLLLVVDRLASRPTHDDLLFLVILFTGFHALMRLGELVFLTKRSIAITEKSLFATLWLFYQHTILFSYLLIKATNFMKAILYSFKRTQRPPTHMFILLNTSIPEISFSRYTLSFGSPVVVWFPPATGFFLVCVKFSQADSPVSPSGPEVLPPLQKPALLSTLFKQPVVGVPLHSGSISGRILSCCTPSFSGAPPINLSIRLSSYFSLSFSSSLRSLSYFHHLIYL